MTTDTYVEHLVKRKTPPYAWPVRILLILLCAASLFIALMAVWGILLLTAVAAGAYFFNQTLSIEYEYLFADGGFSIDRIYNKSRRKKVADCSREELLMVAPSDSFALKEFETNGMKVIDCSTGDRNAKTHSFIFQRNGAHTKVIFEPNDKMLQAVRYSSPRKIVL